MCSSDLDNFASIVAAVAAGRKIFLDIQRAFLYLIGFHIPIVGLALLPPLAGLPLLLMPLHLVWMELIVHPVSALLFQGDPPPADLMHRPPRDPKAPMLPRPSVVRSTVAGALLTIVVFVLYAWSARRNADQARSVALATLILGYQILVLVERAASAEGPHAFLPRSLRFWIIWGAAGISLPILMYIPSTAALFSIARLSAAGWLIAAAAAVVAVGWRIVLARRRAP